MKKSKDNEFKEDSKSTDALLFVIGDQIYSYNGITHPCFTPLTVKKTSQILISVLEAPKITQKLVLHQKYTLVPP